MTSTTDTQPPIPGSAPSGSEAPDLARTPLHALHKTLGGRMVPFAGYDMPVQYRDGIIAEHRHCRSRAGLFDVSHMGQARLTGPGVVAALEALLPGDISALAPGRMRYSLLLNDAGGIRDDLMVTRIAADRCDLVVNAACKDEDFAWIRSRLPGGVAMDILADRALLALQGPEAAPVLESILPGVSRLDFMSAGAFDRDGGEWRVSRSGYTGEDGFEISVPAATATAAAERLLAHPAVAPIGLGARDSLRLEAGLCLYGHDIDTGTTPVEAGLAWTIGKRRRAEGGFPGADHILATLAAGPDRKPVAGKRVARKRVGFRLDGRVPARPGAAIESGAGDPVGQVTSGGFGPSVEAAIGMGYVRTGHTAPGTPLAFQVRGRRLTGQVVRLPFVAHKYHGG